jgi:uncharacterized protein
MEEQDINAALANARGNRSSAVGALPRSLVEAEEKLHERFQRMKSSPLNKLRTLFEFMAQVSEVVGKFIPCKKGCNSCCHYPVSLTPLEIELIETDFKVKRVDAPFPASDFHGTPCPFLLNGCCSIYKSRPFVCRRHVALTRTSFWCHPDRSNKHEFPKIVFSEIDRVYMSVSGAAEANTVFDIRQAFVAPKRPPSLR